ncbi:MAG: hypothetical protein HY922_13775 [Elusimicrobia bacterium]|nr:hypothetical protein [Elusimicrobiota bacterium]
MPGDLATDVSVYLLLAVPPAIDIATLPFQFITDAIASYETSHKVFLDFTGQIADEGGKRRAVSVAGPGYQGPTDLDGEGRFVVHFEEKLGSSVEDWTGKVQITLSEVDIDAFGRGETISATSPSAAKFTVSLQDGAAVWKREDRISRVERFLDRKRDLLHMEWRENKDDGFRIAVRDEVLASEKNLDITRTEIRQAELEQQRREREERKRRKQEQRREVQQPRGAVDGFVIVSGFQRDMTTGNLLPYTVCQTRNRYTQDCKCPAGQSQEWAQDLSGREMLEIMLDRADSWTGCRDCLYRVFKCK